MKGTPLRVGNIGFLLERYGQDCAPLQYVRELTHNSIQAIQRAGERRGLIVWDVDQVYVAASPRVHVTA